MTLSGRLRPALPALLTCLALVLGALGAPPARAASGGSGASAADDGVGVQQTRLRVLTYNLRFGERGLSGLARDIRRSGADVALLQEVDDRSRTGGRHQARFLGRELGMRWVYQGNTATRFGTRGNAILSRFPLGRVRRVDLPNPGVEDRGLLGARVRLPDTRVRVWSTHLSHVSGRLPQARAVRPAVGRPACATVLGGDANDVPGSRAHRVLTTHLRDAWRAAGSGRGATVPADTPRRRIDYLLVRGATPTRIAVTPAGASDHRGVVSTLRLDPGSSC